MHEAGEPEGSGEAAPPVDAEPAPPTQVGENSCLQSVFIGSRTLPGWTL